MSEYMEAIFKGAKGDKGETGDKGQRGLPRGQARAIVYLFLLCIALFVVLGLGLFHYIHANQAAQRRQSEILERRLCATLAPLTPLAALKPPAGNAAANPSRAYEQELSRLLQPLAQLGPDLGCGRH